MPTKSTTISVDEELLKRARDYCDNQKRSFSSLVELLIEQHLNDH